MAVINTAQGVRIGTAKASGVYAGSVKVWPVRMETFGDTFDVAGTPDITKWTATPSPGASIQNVGGQLKITGPGVTAALGNILQSGASGNHTRFDLTNSHAHAHVISPGGPDPAVAFLAPWLTDENFTGNNSNRLFWYIQNGSIATYKQVTGTQSQVGGTVAYSSTTHAWLRIREKSGTTYFDCSSDGTTWNNFSSTPNIPNTNALEVFICQQISNPPATPPAVAIVDNFNRGP